MTTINGAMTQEQRNYLVQRLDEITQDKLRAKEKELFGDNSNHIKAPTWGEVFAAIKAGELVLKEGTEDSTRPYMMPDDCEWPLLEQRKVEFEANKVALREYREQLAVERKRIMDSVILAGVEGAVEALNAYANI